jgi:hypothetical protein
MPAFTFEKIPPPVRRSPRPPAAEKQRGVLVQVLDRFVGVRVKRPSLEEKAAIPPRQKSSD